MSNCTSCGSRCRGDQPYCTKCGSLLTARSEGPMSSAHTETDVGTVNRPVQTPTRRRSRAWIYYAILAVASFIMLCGGHIAGLAGVALFGLYACYLYRGGRIVIWIW